MAMTGAGIRAKPAGGWELRAWIFMRVSGVLLVGLALGHLWIMHVINTVDKINYAFVAQRFGTAFSFWRWYDMALLVLAMLHGLNGARVLIDDYIHARAWHRAAMTALALIGGTFLIAGAVVILTFQPQIP